MSSPAELEKNNFWQRCKNAFNWSAASSISTQGIRMLRVLILTYFIAPDQMGLWVLLMGVVGMVQEFSDSGVKHALIQNQKGNQADYMHTAWTINLIRNILIIAFVYFAAPWVGKYYAGNFNEIELTEILRLSCFLFLFDGLTSISMTVLRKELQFKPLALANIISNIVGLIAAVLLAWKFQHAKGILIGEILCSLTLCIMSYLIHPYRPRIISTGKAVYELLSFGMMAYLVSLIDGVAMRLDVLVAAIVAGHVVESTGMSASTMIGLYGSGMVIILAPCILMSHLTVSVGFPALSIIQKDRRALRKGTLEITKFTQYVSIALFTFLFFLAKDIVKILPEKYLLTGDVIQALCFTGFSIVFLRQMTPALYAMNRVYWCVLRGVLHIIVFAICIVPFFERWHLLGLCWATNVAFIASALFIWAATLYELKWSPATWFKEMSIVWRSWTAGICSFLITFGIFEALGFHWQDHIATRVLCLTISFIVYGYVSFRDYIVPMKEKLYPAT